MDSITHIALGAIVGEAFAGKALGKKAMVIGAVAQSLPDVDFIMAVWLRPVDNLLAHRGFTHSLLFCVAISLLIGFLLARRHRAAGISNKKWALFFGLQMSIHLLLDSFNSYGVGLFEPFSHQRVAFDIIYVADPFYSVALGIGFVAILFVRDNSLVSKKWIKISLTVSTLYLGYAFVNKITIQHSAKVALEKSGIVYQRLLTTPTPLNNWLWYVIAETESGYQVGYRSIFDEPESMKFTYFPRQLDLLKPLADKEDLEKLKRFSKGYYIIQQEGDGLLFNDLRFGQIAGWSNPQAMFAFHYDLLHPDANLFVVQQGRFSSWNKDTVKELLSRIAGIRKGRPG